MSICHFFEQAVETISAARPILLQLRTLLKQKTDTGSSPKRSPISWLYWAKPIQSFESKKKVVSTPPKNVPQKKSLTRIIAFWYFVLVPGTVGRASNSGASPAILLFFRYVRGTFSYLLVQNCTWYVKSVFLAAATLFPVA